MELLASRLKRSSNLIDQAIEAQKLRAVDDDRETIGRERAVFGTPNESTHKKSCPNRARFSHDRLEKVTNSTPQFVASENGFLSVVVRKVDAQELPHRDF
jgi:hypothetical protein